MVAHEALIKLNVNTILITNIYFNINIHNLGKSLPSKETDPSACKINIISFGSN